MLTLPYLSQKSQSSGKNDSAKICKKLVKTECELTREQNSQGVQTHEGKNLLESITYSAVGKEKQQAL